MLIGRSRIMLESCGSTNEVALNMLKSNELGDGGLVVTQAQTNGRGQRGNTWVADPKSNITCSFIVKPEGLVPTKQFVLNMISSIAVAKLVEAYCEQPVSIKWPNDVLVNEKKIAGILIQNILKRSEIDYSIIGIGVNVGQQNFATFPGVSMSSLSQRQLDVDECLETLVETLNEVWENWRQSGDRWLKSVYLHQLLGLGVERRFVEKDRVFTGVVKDVDPMGRLVVEESTKISAYNFGDLKWVLN